MNSLSKNNKGLTLIEVLVTLVLIAIVAVPFLSSFVSAIRINDTAREIQNATSTAQDLTEEFKSEPLENLINKYGKNAGGELNGKYRTEKNAEEGETLNKHIFTNLHADGADGEVYYVDIELDPNVYAIASNGNIINGKPLPEFSNLYGGDTMMIYKPYMVGDGMIEKLFSGVEGLDVSTIDHSKIDKQAKILITCDEQQLSETEYEYEYAVDVTLKYSYQGYTSSEISKHVTKKYHDDEVHSIYLIAPVYDNNTTFFTDAAGNYYSTDKIDVEYVYNGDEANQKELIFCIAEQKRESAMGASLLTRIDPKNVNIKIGVETDDLTTYSNSGNMLKINTNIGKIADLTVSDGDISYTEHAKEEYLYQMTVKVKDKQGKEVTTFATTKEDWLCEE